MSGSCGHAVLVEGFTVPPGRGGGVSSPLYCPPGATTIMSRRSMRGVGIWAAVVMFMSGAVGGGESAVLAQAAATPPAMPQVAEGPNVSATQSTHRWPLVVESDGDEIVMYQPQLETFEGDTLTARAAVSVQKTGQQEPVFGVIWLQSRVATDRTARTVQILDTNITRAR